LNLQIKEQAWNFTNDYC